MGCVGFHVDRGVLHRCPHLHRIVGLQFHVEITSGNQVAIARAMLWRDIELAARAGDIHTVDSQPNPCGMCGSRRVGKLGTELVVVDARLVDRDAVRAIVGRAIHKIVLIKRDLRGSVGRKRLIGCALNRCVREVQVATTGLVGANWGADERVVRLREAVVEQAMDVVELILIRAVVVLPRLG